MRLLPASLVGRVALVSAVGFAASGTAVAVVSGMLADQLARTQEDERLHDAAATLALELRIPGADPGAVAEDETRELAHTGMRLAIFRAGALLAGDHGVPSIGADRCASLGALRACAVTAGPLVAILARDTGPLHAQRATTVRAASVAVLVTSLAGAFVALLIARIVMRPLWRLRDAVDQVPEHEPSAAQLGPDEGVTEVDALRASLGSAFTRLGAALAQSQRFAAAAAHQLRTPLTTVLGELDLVLEQIEPAQAEGIARARKVAHRLSTMIDHLLILARTEQRLAAIERVELLDVVEDTLETLPQDLRARVTYGGEVVTLRADASLLIAMLGSALENALKYSSGPVRVEIAQRREGSLLTVQDEGPGIPEAERERVFVPFYRTPGASTAAVSGSGLGLALIAHVAMLHRGSARFVESAGGARLEIELRE